LLKLVESIHYHYLPKKPIAETARLIQIIITEIQEFAKESTSHIIFVNLKKAEEKDRTPTSIFRNFLGKLSKGKEYVLVEDPTQVGKDGTATRFY